ncbi:hypothetical protein MACJ_001091 [Theileria orientalis]|uniref:Uncharacterized protein n=1 Tax=Theileria orientalis TaxID=68886 RepID=A0A976M7T1_THEOR|nr:hypothetical protein MACJ_001091 [Theileria orientalis]
MEAKVEVVENDVNKQLFSKDFKGESTVKGSNYAINQMLYILGGYALSPTPLPSDLIELWSESEIDKSQPCEYCSYGRSKIAFPSVIVDLKRRIIKFVSMKRACGRCYNIISLKRLLTIIVDSFRDKKDQFNIIYKHFLKVNGLNELDKSDMSDKSTSDRKGDKDLIFQDLVSMAYSLNKVMRIALIWKRSKLVDYGYFKGTEFTLDMRGCSRDVISSDGSDDSKYVDASGGSKIDFDGSSGVNRIISSLSMNFTRRVPSGIREMIESSVADNIERISLNDMLDLIVSLRMCNSLSEPVWSKCTERINKEIKNIDKGNYEDNYNTILHIASELAEHKIVCVDKHHKKPKDDSKKENGKVENISLLGITKFVCDNMKIICETSETKLFRLIGIFHSIFMERSLKEVDEELTNLVLESSIFRRLITYSIDNGNVLSQSSIKSLNDCNRIIDILKLNVMNISYQKYVSGHGNDHDSDESNKEKNNLISMMKLRQCVMGDVYSLLVENISKFTSENIVELIRTVRILGEPYPMKLVNSVVNVYVKHIAQYSINNMLALLEELKLMNIRSEKAMLNTLVCLPRKISTIDSFEHIIRLMQAYEGYDSEYLNVFMQQQIQQIYYKINPKYFQVGLASV